MLKSVEEVSLYFFGGDPIPYIGIVLIDPRLVESVIFLALTGTQGIMMLSVPAFVRPGYYAQEGSNRIL